MNTTTNYLPTLLTNWLRSPSLLASWLARGPHTRCSTSVHALVKNMGPLLTRAFLQHVDSLKETQMLPIQNFHPDTQTLSSKDPLLSNLSVLAMSYSDNTGGLVSCWHVTWRDLLRMIVTRKLWIIIKSRSHPPIAVETNKQNTSIPEYDKLRLQGDN